ncbi:hypothetical protein MKW94_018451 [Papaver nudicaule]|uniref:Uncharacterized protein n=1 Tax=Papaver nudicaule TaxID=74823 RepID=A0AA41VYK6_PAPNU|nr:hypothetical protein [Papaver nudicaule]
MDTSSSTIHDEPEMSLKEEERKSNAILRESLIATRLKQLESSNEYLKAAGLEPISYDPKITQYDWLLKPPSLLKRMYTYIPEASEPTAIFKRKRRSDPTKASTASKEEATGVEVC